MDFVVGGFVSLVCGVYLLANRVALTVRGKHIELWKFVGIFVECFVYLKKIACTLIKFNHI